MWGIAPWALWRNYRRVLHFIFHCTQFRLNAAGHHIHTTGKWSSSKQIVFNILEALHSQKDFGESFGVADHNWLEKMRRECWKERETETRERENRSHSSHFHTMPSNAAFIDKKNKSMCLTCSLNCFLYHVCSRLRSPRPPRDLPWADEIKTERVEVAHHLCYRTIKHDLCI